MLSLWGKPATASNFAGEHQSWAGALGPCAAAPRVGALLWQFVVSCAMEREERDLQCTQSIVWTEKRWRLCLWRQSSISELCPSLLSSISSNAQAEGGTDPGSQVLLYNRTNPIHLSQKKKKPKKPSAATAETFVVPNLPRLPWQNMYFQNLTARLVKFISPHFKSISIFSILAFFNLC